jgi:hypothetical protein
MADLGPANRMTNFDIRAGVHITISGIPVRIGDRRVVLADELKVAGQSIRIPREERKLAGEIVSLQYAPVDFDPPGADHGYVRGTSHFEATIRDANGRMVDVDFGPAQNITGFVLGLGDQVSATGPMGEYQGKTVLAVKQFRKDGHEFALNWETRLPMIQQAAREPTQR